MRRRHKEFGIAGLSVVLGVRLDEMAWIREMDGFPHPYVDEDGNERWTADLTIGWLETRIHAIRLEFQQLTRMLDHARLAEKELGL